jgi:hypothetical protein
VNLRLPGYKSSVADFSAEDLRCGYAEVGEEIDLNDMFCAFTTDNYGVVGGQKTVDDFTPEGINDVMSPTRKNK